jgi:hypothetical protein
LFYSNVTAQVAMVIRQNYEPRFGLKFVEFALIAFVAIEIASDTDYTQQCRREILDLTTTAETVTTNFVINRDAG